MQNAFEKAIKESLNGYMVPCEADKVAERVAKGLIAAGAVIPLKGNEKN